jgi:uncharacterized membrane-anchored protein YhcB (DUF1043 family)
MMWYLVYPTTMEAWIGILAGVSIGLLVIRLGGK